MNTTSKILAAAALLFTLPVSAGSMRCGGQVIEDSGRSGPGKYEVLKKCGEPTARFGNTWIYERGSSKKVVHFHDSGKINTIKNG